MSWMTFFSCQIWMGIFFTFNIFKAELFLWKFTVKHQNRFSNSKPWRSKSLTQKMVVWKQLKCRLEQFRKKSWVFFCSLNFTCVWSRKWLWESFMVNNCNKNIFKKCRFCGHHNFFLFLNIVRLISISNSFRVPHLHDWICSDVR